MSQKFLDRAQVARRLEQMARESVPQQVGMQLIAAELSDREALHLIHQGKPAPCSLPTVVAKYLLNEGTEGY